jgi:hypothetical protein
LVVGKWKHPSPVQFITGYEFAKDGSARVTIRGMKEPIPAHYTWSGDRTLDLEYRAPADVQKAYKAAAKAYKAGLRKRVKKGDMPEKALGPMSDAVPDELPAGETFQVGLSERPRLLILTNKKTGGSQDYEQAD